LAVQDFARGLLKTTCLTVVCGSAAVAGTITEGTSPAPSDFPNTAPGYLLPVGTTLVTGSTVEESADFFEFQGLQPGSTYTISASFGVLEEEAGMFMQVSNSSNSPLGSAASLEGTSPSGSHAVRTGTVPSDGKVVVEIANDSESGGGAYQVALSSTPATPSSTPAPATAGEVVMGLGALRLLWPRLRKKQVAE
jgi:hypothetical protein